MSRHGRTCAAFLVCTLLLLASAHPTLSENSPAGRQYSVAQQRLSDLKKTKKTKKYRSYWIDIARTFERVEKKYPSSPFAAEACFERAGLFLDLFKVSKSEKDASESIRLYSKCQTTYPKHEKAPEALFRIIEINLDEKKDRNAAVKASESLTAQYPKSAWAEKGKQRLGLTAKNGLSQQPTPSYSDTSGKIATISGIRHWSDGASTRVVVDMDTPFKFESHELKNPDRLCFDIKNARIVDSLKREPVPINTGLLKQVRASQFDPSTVRIVLDLASLDSYVAFPLKSHDRLVIDISGDSGTDSSRTSQSESPQKNKPPENYVAKRPARDADSDEKDPRLSLSRQMGYKINTIAIDAGHGGRDGGAVGKNGLKEKEVTLDIAKRLAALLKKRLDSNIIMTRDRDVYVPLDKRPFIARSRRADLFVSIHVNAHRKRKARGIETYIQGLQASDREAMATAARENAMSTKSLSELDNDVDKILEDLKVDNKLEESLQLAWTVQNSLVDPKRPVQTHVVNLGVKRAFFYVLINTKIPSVLAEVGFISNPDEEKLLRKPEYRQKIAEALFEGIKKYIEGRTPQMAGL